MDLRQLEHIIAISEERSITKAAEKLFITQSALNQQLQKLEKEMETPLFIRTRSDWQLTPAGKIYVDSAKEILNIRKDAYNRIHDLSAQSHRQFTIGLIPERGVDMFTAIYPAFHKEWPDVVLEPVEQNVRTMQKQISKGNIDLGLITLTQEQKDHNTYLHMAEEEIFLAVPASHRFAPLGSPDRHTAPEISLSQFQDDSFILIAQTSTMYPLVEKLFEEAGFKPNILFSTSSNVSKYRMVKAGVGCTLLPATFAIPMQNVVYFRLNQHPHWEVTICCRKDAYLSTAEKRFIELCQEYWDEKLGKNENKSCDSETCEENS